METLELFYPQISARAGPYTFDKGVEIEVYSSKPSYFDWAKIRFTAQFQPKISLKMCIRDRQGTMSGSEAGTKYAAFLGAAAKGGDALGLSFLDANNQLKSMPEIPVSYTHLIRVPSWRLTPTAPRSQARRRPASRQRAGPRRPWRTRGATARPSSASLAASSSSRTPPADVYKRQERNL